MQMTSPLVQRLVDEFGYPWLDETTVDAFANHPVPGVLFFAGNARRYREVNDVAVVLPELVGNFQDRLRAGVVAEPAEKVLQKRYGVRKWPTLVFVRGGGYLGAIMGIKEWDFYVSRIEMLLDADPTQPPSPTQPAPNP